MPLMRFATATRFCKVCMKDFRPRSILIASNPAPSLCLKCRKSFHPHIRRWKIGDVPCLSLYEYDDGLRGVIYRFKGCGDYELRSVLVENYLFWAKLKFSKCMVVPAPSWPKHDEARGFNHVYAIFEQLGLPMMPLLYKKEDRKQSDQSAAGRKEIRKYLGLNDPHLLKGKDVLLVDDVYTTGFTIKACIDLIQKAKPKSLRVMVIARTLPGSKRGSKNGP